MEKESLTPCPNAVTVRRNPHRKARATPSTDVPPPMPFTSSSSSSIVDDIPSFPIQDVLSIEVHQNPNSKLSTSQPPSSEEVPVSESLKVFLRIRPLTPHLSEKIGKNGAQTCKSRIKNAWPQNPIKKNTSRAKVKKSNEICVAVNDSHSVTLCPPRTMQDAKRVKSEVYEGFSHVFTAESSQDEVYEKMVNPLVEDFLKGKSGMLAALGPSGSGKTHTVFGCPREPGVVPLALRRIFSGAKESGIQSSRSFYLSMFEIYSERGKAERMIDLSQDGGDLCMQQSTIKGLQEVFVSNAQQAESLIACGMLKRATATTNSNNQSSRSQCIINIHSASSNNIDGEVDAQSNNAVLTIVDLAGAEREKRTGNQGARLLESNFINNTSMVFGLCLRSLLEHQKNRKKPLQKHFQSSLLTRYLREYMEGKKRMTLILTIKAGEDDYLDASFSLRQASPYMKIKFDNVELCNKRHFHTSSMEQLKRMKFSSLEAYVIDEDKGVGGKSRLQREVFPKQMKEVERLKGYGYFASITNSEVNDGSSLGEDCIDSAKKEKRGNQIMQGFAKALWNVLKEYKKKLKVAENEICILRESLAKEKTWRSNLENELKNLKSYNSSGGEVSGEISQIKMLGSKTNISSELEACHSPNFEKVKGVSSSKKGVSSSNLEEVKSFNSNHGPDTTCINQKHESVIKNADNAKDLRDSEYMGREDPHVNDDATDSGSPESLASSSESFFIVRNDDNSSIMEDQLQNEQNKWLDRPIKPGEDSAFAQGCEVGNTPKNERKLNQVCDVSKAQESELKLKSSKPEKPKRRLLPASSILLKDVSCLDVEDENEKPKGARGEKKAVAEDIKRTQGSITLLRLLRSNLRV